MSSSIHRHYRISNLNFRDFWDICSHYQRVHPRYRQILYSVEGFGLNICENEGDVSKVLQAITEHENQVRRFTARYYISPHSEPGDYGNAKLEYLTESLDFLEPGLHFYTENENKLLLFQFEEYLYNSYQFEDDAVSQIEYGLPCEVLAAVIDMRGFSSFTEQPGIESPYTCGLMTAFYSMVRNGFKRFPPELVKFLGDGVLAVWQTNAQDRHIAIETCIQGLREMPQQWRIITKGPEFTHGAPEGIGSGVSFGLASKISIDNDFLGRPINVASRFCALCPSGKTYISRNVPGMDSFEGIKPLAIRVKSYGEQKIWVSENN